jgi:putative transposase
MSYKTTDVQVKKANGEFETRHINRLSSQLRQGLNEQIKRNLWSLSGLRRRGHRVGSLKYISRISSIPLVQYDRTHRIDGNRVKIQGMERPFVVRGIEQIPKGAEPTSARLVKRGKDYFLHITCYVTGPANQSHLPAIGVDSGIRRQFVFSNGAAVRIDVPITGRTKRLHRELTRRKKWGNNWFKTRGTLNSELRRTANRRLDVRRKIVSYLISNYDCIATQKDTVSGWQRLWGRRVLSTAIGGIMSDLRIKPHTPQVVERFVPTTKKCSQCDTMNEIGLGERIYKCSACGLAIDRDLNAARNIWLQIPAERRELTPVDNKAAAKMVGYFNGIPFVSASLVEEAGSHTRS